MFGDGSQSLFEVVGPAECGVGLHDPASFAYCFSVRFAGFLHNAQREFFTPAARVLSGRAGASLSGRLRAQRERGIPVSGVPELTPAPPRRAAPRWTHPAKYPG